MDPKTIKTVAAVLGAVVTLAKTVSELLEGAAMAVEDNT